MRKLKLDPDALRVETFTPASIAGRAGTVHAHGTWDSCGGPCEPDLSIDPCSPPPPSGAYTCDFTCGYTCSCGCNNTRAGWTCDPYAAECQPVPQQ